MSFLSKKNRPLQILAKQEIEMKKMMSRIKKKDRIRTVKRLWWTAVLFIGLVIGLIITNEIFRTPQTPSSTEQTYEQMIDLSRFARRNNLDELDNYIKFIIERTHIKK